MPLSHYINSKKLNAGIPLPKNYELKFIKLSILALFTFLVTFLTISICTPPQNTQATGEILMAVNSTDSAISLSTSASPVNLSLTAGTDGAVRTASDTVTITSGSTGYQLYISAATANNALIRDGTDGTTGTDIIPATLATDLSIPTALSNDTWGFAVANSADAVENGFDDNYPTGDNSIATSKFIAVPGKGNDILIAKHTGAANAIDTNFYYGARVTTAKTSGLYKGTVTYTAISNNGASGLASVSPSRTNIIQGGETLTVTSPSTLALSSIASTDITVGGAACANATAIKSDGGSGSLVNATCISPSLPTGWHEVIINFTAINNTVETYIVSPGIEYYLDGASTELAAYMQDFTASECANMNTNTTTILQDKRDNNLYSVSKLPDGNCWMTSNLRLGNTITSSGSIEINSATSDYTGEPFTITSSDIITSDGEDWSDPNILHIYARTNSEKDVNGNIYGNLYNWYAATAKSGTGGDGGVPSSGDATSSLCPKNWKLPPYAGNGSYINLFQTPTSKGGFGLASAYGADATLFGASATVTQSPYSFSLSGDYYNKAIQNLDVRGIYWTRTARNATGTYVFYYTVNGFFDLQGLTDGGTPTSNFSKVLGRSIRCVFQPTLQNFTTVMCNNLETAKTITLWDGRDYNDYTVAKLADGNCWLTQNLRLGTSYTGVTQGITLTPANSDVSSNYIINASNIQTSGGSDWSTDYYVTRVYSFAGTANEKTYGNLYNWFTATAGTGTASMSSGNAPSSLCPKNWKLPPNTGNGSYTNLLQTPVSSGGLGLPAVTGDANSTNKAYTDAMQSPPYNFTLSAYYGPTYANDQGVRGDYWTSTVHATNIAYYIFFNTGGHYLIQDSNVDNLFGRALRCVLTT